METNVTLQNSTELHLNNDEVFLRSIPAKLKVGTLTTDTLRLLVYYVTKASPYELAVESGNFEGTLQEWLESLQANLSFKAIVDTYADLATVVGLEQGDLAFVTSTGKAYPFSGTDFPAEDTGLDITGDSAYQLAKKAGFVGTESEWLATLKGAKGDQGIQGVQGDTGLKGETGEQGDQGPAGADGADGKSAYTLATELGFVGSEADWILSLKGPQGIKGETGDTGPAGADGTDGVTQDATSITLTGLVTTTATPVVAIDTLLAAIGKLQAQVTVLDKRVPAETLTVNQLKFTTDNVYGSSNSIRTFEHLNPGDVVNILFEATGITRSYYARLIESTSGGQPKTNAFASVEGIVKVLPGLNKVTYTVPSDLSTDVTGVLNIVNIEVEEWADENMTTLFSSSRNITVHNPAIVLALPTLSGPPQMSPTEIASAGINISWTNFPTDYSVKSLVWSVDSEKFNIEYNDEFTLASAKAVLKAGQTVAADDVIKVKLVADGQTVEHTLTVVADPTP